MSKQETYDNLDSKKVEKIKKRIENNSNTVDKIVNQIIEPYCKELDEYVQFVYECLLDDKEPVRVAELEDFCLNLSTYIYFASGMCERLGIRDDIGKAVYKEMYHTARSSQSKGTIDDKNSFAELSSQQEYITSVCYTRAYKTMKAKVENAQEILASCKKVLGHRMQEEELTRIGGK